MFRDVLFGAMAGTVGASVSVIQRGKKLLFEPYAGSFFGSVALAPFHDFEAGISQDIVDQLAEISELLLNNELDTGYPLED